MKIIIAGGGTAALEAALTIRQHDKNSIIDIYSAENALPYRRTLLPELLAGKFNWENLQYYPADFYRNNAVNIHLNTPVINVNPVKQQIITADNKTVSYDRLLMATGKTPRQLPLAAGLPDSVFSLHSYTDLLRIEEKLSTANNAVIIGGGILGLECAAALLQRKLKVTLIEQTNTLLHGILDIESAKFLQSELLKNNPLLTVYTASSIDKIEKSDKYITCYFSNPVKHKLQTDFIITAIGLVDNRNWGFELSTDKYLQVNHCKNIFAAGDCAAVCGKTTRFYKEARLQGRIAGKNIAGKTTEYSFPISECRSVFNNIPIYTAGTTDVNSTECLTEYNSNSMKKLFYRQDKLIGCILAGDIRTSGDLYEVIQKNHLPPR